MTGHDISTAIYQGSADLEAPPRLELKSLTVPGAVEAVDLRLRSGDIIGLSGLIGAGRTDLALALFGMRPDHTGEICIDGKPVSLNSVSDAIRHRIAYVPEDRLTEGLFLTQSVQQNILASSLDRITRGIVVDRARAEAWTAEMIKAMQIAAPSGSTSVGDLSGGNQQRVVLARWLLTEARILVLNGPTVVVDVGSKAEIHRIIRDLAVKRGLAVLMISDDIPELLGNCSEVILMHRGRFVERYRAGSATEVALTDRLRTLR